MRSGRLHLYQTALILLIIASAVPAALGNMVSLRKDFHTELWAPAWLLVHGRSPYATEVLDAPLPAVWLPMAIGVFAPLGWLREEAATQVWFLLSVAAVGGIVFLALHDAPSPFVVIAAALIAYLFPPTLNHFVLGQFSILAALCLVLAARFVKEGREWPAALLLALGSAKPQLALLPALGLVFYISQQTSAKAAAKFAGKTLLAALLLSLPVFLVSPGWLGDYLAGWRRNPAWQHPSAFALLGGGQDFWSYLISGALAAAGIVICLALWRKLTPERAMYWTLALTVLLSPYIWSWDFVLLLPLLLHTFGGADLKGKLLLLTAYVMAWAGMAFIQLAARGENQLFWWVPWWLTGTVAIVTTWNRSTQP